MKIDPWRSATIVPVFLYAVVAAVWAFTGVTVGLVAGFFLTGIALPGAALYGRRLLPFAPGAILAAAIGLLWFFNGAPPTGALGDVAAGVLLASPLVFLAAVWVTEDLPGTSVAMVIIGLTDAVGLLAASRNLGTAPGTNGPSGLLDATAAVYGQQGSAIAQLLRGRLPSNIPMSSTPDALFVLLGILAMVGLLLSLLRGPGIEWLRSAPGPAPPRHPAGTRVPHPVPSPELAGILASATRSELPEFPSYTGLYPVLAAAGAAAGFLGVAEFAPTYALLAVALGVALAVVYLLVTGGARRVARPSPSPPAGPLADPRRPKPR
jgi:hypothetical protein